MQCFTGKAQREKAVGLLGQKSRLVIMPGWKRVANFPC
nr:hypothetical protein [uncultured bacterium]